MILFGQPSLVQIFLIKLEQGGVAAIASAFMCLWSFGRQGVAGNDCVIKFNYNIITILFADRLPKFVFLFLISL